MSSLTKRAVSLRPISWLECSNAGPSAPGRQLNVEAMSLYNHIANKDDLLDGMVDLVIAEIALPSMDAGWRDAMRARAFSARAAFTRHPWAPALIDSRIGGGLGRLRYFEAVLGALRRAGFSVELTARAFSLIDSYIYGFGRQSLSSASSIAEDVLGAEAFLQTLPADEFPYLAEMAATQAARPGYAGGRAGGRAVMVGQRRLGSS